MDLRKIVLGVGASCLLLGTPVLHAQAAGSNPSVQPSKASGVKGELSGSDQSFLENATQAAYAEIEAGKLASTHTRNPKVLALASLMVKDHGAANAELLKLAKRKGYTPPTEPSVAERVELKALGTMDAEEFDKMFASHLGIAAHEKAIVAFQNASGKADDVDVRAYAKKHMAMLKKHLTMARQVGGTDRGM